MPASPICIGEESSCWLETTLTKESARLPLRPEEEDMMESSMSRRDLRTEGPMDSVDRFLLLS